MVLNVVVKIYNLMRDISTQIVRYENFMMEKNENIKSRLQNLLKTSKEVEESCIWDFMNKIIVNIEIQYEDKNQVDNKEGDEKCPLRLFYFKKLPSCFFLTPSMKRSFMEVVKIDSLE